MGLPARERALSFFGQGAGTLFTYVLSSRLVGGSLALAISSIQLGYYTGAFDFVYWTYQKTVEMLEGVDSASDALEALQERADASLETLEMHHAARAGLRLRFSRSNGGRGSHH